MTDESVHDATEEWVRRSITKEFTPIDINDVYKAFAAGARWQSQQAQGEAQGFTDYDAGALNDWGGGDVGWWQDYIRSEIERANDHWREQTGPEPLYLAPPAPAAVPDEAFNIIEGIRAELTWPGWRSTRSRDWVMDRISELLSMLTASPAPEHSGDSNEMPGWEPIETAPMDGTHIQLYRPKIQFVGYYGGANSGWRHNAPGLDSVWPLPTHWMPLRNPPQQEEAER